MPFSQYQCDETFCSVGAIRLPHFEGGDCPRNPKMALTFEQDEKAGTFAGCFAMEFRHDSFAGLRCCGIRVICKVAVHPSREEGSLSL